MRGKYSPTVSAQYYADQDWWRNNGPHDEAVNYDKDGYDSYGYDVRDVDRRGIHEDAYAFMDDDEWDQIIYEEQIKFNDGDLT